MCHLPLSNTPAATACLGLAFKSVSAGFQLDSYTDLMSLMQLFNHIIFCCVVCTDIDASETIVHFLFRGDDMLKL